MDQVKNSEDDDQPFFHQKIPVTFCVNTGIFTRPFPLNNNRNFLVIKCENTTPENQKSVSRRTPSSLDDWKVLLKFKQCQFKSLYRVSEFFWHYLPLRRGRKKSLCAISVLFCCPDFRELEPITAIEKTRLKSRRPSSSEIKI